jgi:tryptophan synthase beta chain
VSQAEVELDQFDGPDASGHFGPYGGIFVGETLVAAVEELAAVYKELSADKEFWRQYDYDLKHYVGRPSPLSFTDRLTAHSGGSKN